MAERLFVCWPAGPRWWDPTTGSYVRPGVVAPEPYQFCPKNPDNQAGHTHPADHIHCGWGTWTAEEAT